MLISTGLCKTPAAVSSSWGNRSCILTGYQPTGECCSYLSAATPPHNTHLARALFKSVDTLPKVYLETQLHPITPILLDQLVNLQELTDFLLKSNTLLISWCLFTCPIVSLLTTVLTNLLESEVSPAHRLDPSPTGTMFPASRPFHTTDDLRNSQHFAV